MINKQSSWRIIAVSLSISFLLIAVAMISSGYSNTLVPGNTEVANASLNNKKIAQLRKAAAKRRLAAAKRRQAARQAAVAKRRAAARARLENKLSVANQRRINLYNDRLQRKAEGSPTIQSEIDSNQRYSVKGSDSDNNTKKPNILYVLTDDQPIETMSVMRKTLDWFKKEGRIYNNAFVATPICCPSRTEAMTGQYAHNNEVLNNNGALLFREKIWMRNPFNQEEYRQYDKLPWTKTLQCDLYRNGYKNVIFGKYVNGWKNDNPWNRNGAVPTCFDPQESWMGFDNQHRGTGGTTTKDVAQSHPGSDDYLGNKTVEFIRNQKQSNKPWFAYLSLHSPHLPLAPAARYRNWTPPPALRHRRTASETPYSLYGKPPYVQNTAWNKFALKPGYNTARYALGQQRMVQSVDDTMNRLRQVLKNTKQDRNTIIIFTSDNGLLWGDHGLYNKFYPYLDSIEVPMMVIAPGKIRRGSRDNRIVSNIDIAPTVYDLTDIDPMFHQVDGYSMTGSYRRDWLLIESGDNGVTPYWSAAINKDYQYIETGYDKTVGSEETSGAPKVPTSPNQISFKEYYNLNNFQGSQRNNIAYPNPGRVNGIEQLSNLLQYKSWAGPGYQPGQRGCYGTMDSDSSNPCP
jgi:arylsulfatase A-like enzyme